MESQDLVRVSFLKAAGDLCKLTKEILIVFKVGKLSQLALGGEGSLAGERVVVSDVRRQAPNGL